MNFQEFTKRIKQEICGTQIQEETVYCGHNIIQSNEGVVFVDFKKTELSSIEEAKRYIKQIKLEEELIKELYDEIPQAKIANIIKEHYDIKVTDTLIESYVELASSKLFTVDPVVTEIRKMNSIDNIVEGKIDYLLDDGSIIAIDENTSKNINNLLENNSDIVQYMRESKDNFMRVIRELD